MSGEKRLDQSHPDCAEYTAKFRKVWDDYRELEEREKAKYPDWRGKDHPANDVLRPAYRECCRKMKALQKQYSYLFVEVEEDEPEHSTVKPGGSDMEEFWKEWRKIGSGGT